MYLDILTLKHIEIMLIILGFLNANKHLLYCPSTMIIIRLLYNFSSFVFVMFANLKHLSILEMYVEYQLDN